MESLLANSFSHDPTVNVQTLGSRFDIVGPNGDIILPAVWESVIQPGWVLELRPWPTAGLLQILERVQPATVGALNTPSSSLRWDRKTATMGIKNGDLH